MTDLDTLRAHVAEGTVTQADIDALLALLDAARAEVDALREDMANPDAYLVPKMRHPFTCGYCDWGRDGAYHDHIEYQSHMAIAHPEYKS